MLKCMICGEEKVYINGFHLKKHGLTTQQYRERFNAPLLSREYWIRRTLKRLCRLCGSPFTTQNPSVVYCPKCQPKVSLEVQRRHKRLYYLKEKFTSRFYVGEKHQKWRRRRWSIGTFDEKYLEIVEGRVFGVVFMERRISLKFTSIQQCECTAPILIDIVDHEPYCPECGSRIILARENEHYSAIEPVCSFCGLVYDTKNPS